MIGLKLTVIFLFSLTASSHAWFWDRSAKEVSVSPPVRQLPISYIRAFAYHPVAFPQPLAPITTYQVSRNPQSYVPNRNIPSSSTIGGAIAQGFQQQFFQSQDSPMPQPLTQQQLPINSQAEFGTPPTTTPTTTSTTTPAPTTQTQSFSPSPQVTQFASRGGIADGGYQRQLQQSYQSGNFGGFPQYYNQYQYNDVGSNPFSPRGFNSEPTFQQYTADPVTYQFIPTSITPIKNQNNVKFVPCMCPVAVSISPPMVEKRSDEIPLLQPTTESEPSQPSPQAMEETL